MEIEHTKNEEEMWRDIEKSHRRGKIMGGLVVVATGALFLARELGVDMPHWLFTWKMLLIALGLILAVKHKFLHPGWIILVGVGGLFLVSDIYPELNIRPILWPVLIIIVGLIIVFKPRSKHSYKARMHWRKWHRYQHHQKEYQAYMQDYLSQEEPNREDYVDSLAVMASVKKNMISKKFKGGEVVNVFGGTELNLTQADFEEKVSLEITQVFGGTRLVIPANWELRSELVTIFGSVEDKRPAQVPVSGETPKVLVLTGTTVFGGLDINSY